MKWARNINKTPNYQDGVKYTWHVVTRPENRPLSARCNIRVKLDPDSLADDVPSDGRKCGQCCDYMQIER